MHGRRPTLCPAKSAIRNPQSAIAVLLLLLATLTLAGHAQEPASEPLWVRWEHQAPPLRWLALSPEGSRLVSLDWRGEATCVEPTGRVRWIRRLDVPSRIKVGPEAGLTAAYQPHSPLHPELLLIGPAGEDRLKLDCGGPVEEVAISSDGRRVAAGTGANTICLVVFEGTRPQQQRVRVPGAATWVGFGRAGELYFATAGPTGLGRLNPDATLDWYVPGSADVRNLVSVAPGGNWVAVAEQPLAPRRLGTLRLWNRKRRCVWSQPLAGRPVLVRAAEDAQRIVVGLEGRTSVGQVQRRERLLVCLGPEGSLLWQKGGPFFGDPLFVTMDATGDRVVSLNRQSKFYLLRGRGQIWWRRSSPAPVQIAVGSADGSSVAVACTDGRLTWLQVRRSAQH